MKRKKLYEDLAKHLNQGIIGAPMSRSLMGILEIMFNEEEAEIAGNLPFDNKSLEELKILFPDKSRIPGDYSHRHGKKRDGIYPTETRQGKDISSLAYGRRVCGSALLGRYGHG